MEPETVYLIDRTSFTITEFFNKTIPNCEVIDEHICKIDSEEFEIIPQEIVGVEAGDIYAYKLIKL